MGDAEPSLEIRLLGTFAVYRDGERIRSAEWGKPKTAWILKFLLLHRDKIVPSDQLIEALYPDHDPAKVRKNLFGRISQLRRALEPDLARGPDSRFVETVAEGYRFNADGCWLDVEAFERTLQEADSLRESEQWGQAIGRYHDALQLYVGDLLPEAPYEEWALEPRQRLRERYRLALEGAAICHVHLERYHDAIRQLEELLGDDPSRESAARWLMLAHHFHGAPDKVRTAYEACANALQSTLDVEPSAETQELLARIERGKVATPKRDTPHNLPRPISRFVGRENELAELQSLLRQERLITLTGAGGAGKTRLAIEIAHELIDEFSDGVWHLDLSPLSEASEVGRTLLRILALGESDRRSPQQVVIDHLSTKCALLVLDNAEHLLSACAQLALEVLQRCPSVTILTTSRERLGVTGEIPWPVPALDLPDDHWDTDQLHSSEAVRLFVDRARAVQGDFRLSTQTAAPVAQICRRLDGLPLALELAAARLDVFAVSDLAERLEDHLRVPADDRQQSGRSHQRTLEATLDWSHALLSSAERSLFRRLSVFVGSFSLNAVEMIFGDTHPHQGQDLLTALAGLVHKSLIVMDAEQGTTRYRLLDTIRAYGLRKLDEREDADGWRSRHLRYFRDLVEEANPNLDGPEATRWLDHVEVDYANIRAALRHAYQADDAKDDGLRLIHGLWRFWIRRTLWIADAIQWVERGLELTEGERTFHRAMMLSFAGWLNIFRHDPLAAIGHLTAAEPLLAEIGEETELAATRNMLGVARWRNGERDRGKAWIQASVDLYRKLGDRKNLAGSLNNLGGIAIDEGHYNEARNLYQQALTVNRHVGKHVAEGMVLRNMGALAEFQSDFAEAERRHRQSLSIFQAMGSTWQLSGQLGNLALVLAWRGKHDEAHQLASEALEPVRATGDSLRIGRALTNLGMVQVIGGDNDEAWECFEQILMDQRMRSSGRHMARTLIGVAACLRLRGCYRVTSSVLGHVESLKARADADVQGILQLWHQHQVSILLSYASDGTFERAYHEGKAMRLEDIVELVARVVSPSKHDSETAGSPR